MGSVKLFFLQEWRFGCSRLSKVIHFGTNRKRVYDFLLVRHIVTLVLSYTVSEIRSYCRFFVLMSPPLFTLILGCSNVGVNVSRCLKLFGREIIFEGFQHHRQHVWKKHTWTSRTRTDSKTDRRHCGITALCVASRGKKQNWWSWSW